MRRTINLATIAAIFAAVALGAVGCTRDKATPEEEMQQAFADVRAEIQSVITDPERAAKAIDLVTQVEQRFFDVNRTIEARRARFRELNANYDATRAEIDSELDRILSSVKANRHSWRTFTASSSAS